MNINCNVDVKTFSHQGKGNHEAIEAGQTGRYFGTVHSFTLCTDYKVP